MIITKVMLLNYKDIRIVYICDMPWSTIQTENRASFQRAQTAHGTFASHAG